MADEATFRVAGHEVRITHPDKVFFACRGETKADLARYYRAVEVPLLSALGDRPTLMHRYPDGADGDSFFQKRVPSGAPDWLTTRAVSTPTGTTGDALVLADLAHVLWAVNLGCLGFHPWAFRVRNDDDRPSGEEPPIDELRIDLDRSSDVAFDRVRAAAHATRELLDEEGIRGFVKTTGGNGLHVHVPVAGSPDAHDVRRAAVTVARELERRHPDLLTARWWKEERGRRVFVDFNQNAPHKTTFGAWCVRSTATARVSCPLRWDEIDEVEPETLTMATVPDKLARDGDPWADMYDEPSAIDDLVARWWDDVERGIPDEPWPPQYPKQPHEGPRVAPSRRAEGD